MVTIDPRVGSKELKPLLDALYLDTQLEELAAGDFAFEGNSPKGKSRIGIERKVTTDLLACMRDARFTGKQLPRMIEMYDPGCRYLLIEGITRANPSNGLLEEQFVNKSGTPYWREVSLGRQRFSWDTYDKYITSLEWAPIKVRRTLDEFQTARMIQSLYHYYQKDWSHHKSVHQLHHQPDQYISLEDKENPVRCVAKEFPGIGVEKSLACAIKWRNVFDMVTSETADWRTIPGVGPTISRKVMNWIHGIEDDGGE